MKHLIHKLSGLIILTGAVLIVGTAGASDLGVLEFGTIAYRCLMGLGLIGVGAGVLKLTNYSFM